MPIARALTSILHRTGVHARLQEAWRRDVAHAVETASLEATRGREEAVTRLERLEREHGQSHQSLESRLAEYETRLSRETTAIHEIQARVSELERAAAVNNRQVSLLVDWLRRGTPDLICAHVARAITDAQIRTTPAAYMLVERLFPADFHVLLRTSLPEASLIAQRDSKENTQSTRF